MKKYSYNYGILNLKNSSCFLMFATNIGEDILPTTSRREIILLKYEKAYRINKILFDRLVGFRQRS